MFLENWLKAVNYRITEGREYRFASTVPALFVSYWDGDSSGVSAECIYSENTYTIIQMTVSAYSTNKSYRWTNPEYRGHVTDNYAYDDVLYIDLELEEDILEKMTKIVNYESYDTRVSVPLEMGEDELFTLMSQAHAKDVTLNQYVTSILEEYINT